MQTTNRFFDDLSRLANGALGAAAGVRAEIEAMMRDRLQRLIDDMDLVRREEFEAVRDMAAKAREEQEALAIRVAALERQLAERPAPATAAPAPTPGASSAPFSPSGGAGISAPPASTVVGGAGGVSPAEPLSGDSI